MAAVDGRRDLAEVPAAGEPDVGPAGGGPRTSQQLVDATLRPLGLLRLADGGEPGAAPGQPVARAPGAQGGHRPGHHPPDHHAFRRPLPPFRRDPGGARLPRRLHLGALPGGARRRDLAGLPLPEPLPGRHPRDGPVGGIPRVRPRGRRAARGSDPGRDGRRFLPVLAGVLHRRHRQLPPRPRRPAAHRPRWPVLQRARRAARVRHVVAHRLARPAAHRGHAGAADDPAAGADAALRRLPRAGRRHRRPRPVPADRADPEGAAARARRSRRRGAEDLGARRGHALGAGRGPADARSRCSSWCCRCPGCWPRPGCRSGRRARVLSRNFGDGDFLGVLARALAIVVPHRAAARHRLRARAAGPADRRRHAAAHRGQARPPGARRPCSPRRWSPGWPGPGGRRATATGRCTPTRAAPSRRRAAAHSSSAGSAPGSSVPRRRSGRPAPERCPPPTTRCWPWS